LTASLIRYFLRLFFIELATQEGSGTTREREEKEIFKSYENQRRHFTLFVVSTDGMYGFETRAFLKKLAKLLAEEWEKPYPTVRGFINARMSITLVRATNRCIRGSRIPATTFVGRRYCWESRYRQKAYRDNQTVLRRYRTWR